MRVLRSLSTVFTIVIGNHEHPPPGEEKRNREFDGPLALRGGSPLGRQYYFDTAVLFVVERLVHFGTILE